MVKRFDATSVFVFFVIFHFSIVFIALASDYLKLNKIESVTYYYMYPFFEQHWGMFAPNPPSSSLEVLVAYMNQEGDSTDFFNLSNSLILNNKAVYFGLSQRLIKYFHGTINSLLKGYPLETSDLTKENIEDILAKNPGFQCIKAYVNIHQGQMEEFNQNFKPVKFRILIIETSIRPPNTRDLDEDYKKGVLIDLGYLGL